MKIATLNEIIAEANQPGGPYLLLVRTSLPIKFRTMAYVSHTEDDLKLQTEEGNHVWFELDCIKMIGVKYV